MRRRELIAGLAGVAASPCAGNAQQPAMPMIGFLSGRSQDEASADTAAFHQSLKRWAT
jgi:putative tryptophan/tyrosine transport system substrate-binding protein